jgi:23S rRNA pseudouridine1911/1915/1917 synthase
MNEDDKEKAHILSFQVEGEHAGLLKDYLRQTLKMSRRTLVSVKNEGKLLVNKQEVSVRHLLKKGDRIEVYLPVEEPSHYLKPESIDLNILYEDEAVLMVNKPAGLCVHPTFSQKTGTIANSVMYHWLQKGQQATFHAVNRLDKDTSGVVVIARNRFIHQQLALQQQSGQLKRRYYVWVNGLITPERATITQPIGRKEGSIIEREVSEHGQRAITHYRMLQATDKASLLDVILETGRTHQIRLHFSYVGHALLGDSLYGGKTDLIQRQALHAYQTECLHPISGQPLVVRAPLPKDLSDLQQTLFDTSRC